ARSCRSLRAAPAQWGRHARRGRLPDGDGVKVLIAEDDPLIALGLAERIGSLGHETIGPAADGLEAIALARAETPDLYLFDIEMPNIDGLEAAGALAAGGVGRAGVGDA